MGDTEEKDTSQQTTDGGEGHENDTDTGSEGTDDTKKGNEAGDGGDDQGDGGDGKDDSPEGGDEDKEPPTRKRLTDSEIKDRIIERKNRQIEREKKKHEKDGADDDDDDDSGDDDDVDAKVGSAVKKELEPFKQQMQIEQDERDVDKYIGDNPEFKGLRDKALNLMKHPSRQSLPIDVIMAEAAGGTKGLMKLGAKKAKQADDDANSEGGGGGSDSGSYTPKKKVWDQTDEEFAQTQQEILSGNSQ